MVAYTWVGSHLIAQTKSKNWLSCPWTLSLLGDFTHHYTSAQARTCVQSDVSKDMWWYSTYLVQHSKEKTQYAFSVVTLLHNIENIFWTANKINSCMIYPWMHVVLPTFRAMGHWIIITIGDRTLGKSDGFLTWSESWKWSSGGMLVKICIKTMCYHMILEL